MSALIRWDGFLAQIEERHRAVRDEAQAAGHAFIASVASGGDYLPLSHQLGAVRARLQELETKIIDTWHAKVDDTITGEGHGEAARTAAYDQGDDLKHALDNLREELEINLMADLARARFAAATAALRPVVCGKCGASYAPPQSFRIVELPCGGCGAPLSYEPDELMRSAGAIGTHPIPHQGAVEEWRAMRAAERALHRVRPPRYVAIVQAYEAAQVAYWRKYLAARAYFEPELGRDLAMEVRRRMEQWYVYFAENEESWVAAGRPRAV